MLFIKDILNIEFFKINFNDKIKELKHNKDYILDLKPDFKTDKTYIYFDSYSRKFGINISFNMVFDILLNVFMSKYNKNYNEEEIVNKVAEKFYFYFESNVYTLTKFLYLHEYNHFSRFHCSKSAELFPFHTQNKHKLLNIIFDLQINDYIFSNNILDEFTLNYDLYSYVDKNYITVNSLIDAYNKTNVDILKQEENNIKIFFSILFSNGFSNMNALDNSFYDIFVKTIYKVYNVDLTLDNGLFLKWVNKIFNPEENGSKSSNREIKNIDGGNLTSDETKVVEQQIEKKQKSSSVASKDNSNSNIKLNLKEKKMNIGYCFEKYFNFSRHSENEKYKRTYRRLNRRQSFYNHIKKGLVRDNKNRRNILNIIIDTSFSMSFEDYESILGILKSISDKYDSYFRVALGGTYISKFFETKDFDEIKKQFNSVEPGGTNLDNLVNEYVEQYYDKFYIKKGDKFKNLIIFTDGNDYIGNSFDNKNKLFVCTEVKPDLYKNIKNTEILLIKND